MSSPFSIFRKNQKVMLAVLTTLAMFGFILLPTILQLMGGSRSVADPVVLKTTKFGSLRKSHLQILQNSHVRVMNVLGQLQAMGDVGAAVAAGKISEEEGKGIQDRYAAAYRQQIERIFGGGNPADVAKIWLLARQAEQSGMIISEEMIRSFVKGITQNVVKSADIQAVFSRAGLSAEQFFSLMRDELLAYELRNEFRVSLYASTPGQRWDYFNRLNRMATIEAIPVPVADYVKQVPDPKEEVLKTFFEENKERYSSPDSPEPGFHRPHRVALEYFRADYDKFASPQTVTEAEIRQEYEKHQEYYDQIEKQAETPPAEKKETPAEKKDQKAAEKPDAKKAPKVEKKAPKVEKKESKGEKKESKGVSSITSPLPKGEGTSAGAAPIVLAAFAQNAKPDDKAQPPANAQPPAKAAEPVKQSAAGAKAGKSADQAAGGAGGKSSNPAPKGDAPKAEPPKTGLPELPKAVLSEAVKKVIRRRIAQERILKVFEGLRVQMDQYGQEWSKYEVERITSQSAGGGQKPLGSPPPAPDFAELAKQNHLAADHTALIARWEAETVPIGTSQPAQIVDGQLAVNPRGAPVCQYAFQSLPTFRPAISVDGGGLYLYWKTKDEKEHVPKFEDVRDDVLHMWKMIEAQKPALKQAKLLAAEADKAGKSLKKLFADRPDVQVVLPPKFSWMTVGNLASLQPAQYARLSPVAGVEMAGEEFMRTVFGLEKPGQVAVTFNAPKTIAYVVQLNEFSPVYEVRKSQFETDNFRKYDAVGADDQKQIEQAWLKEIERSAGFEWTPGNNPAETSDSGQPAGPSGPTEPDEPGDD
jgi:hypothetical protein